MHHSYFILLALWLASARCYHRLVGSVRSGRKGWQNHEDFLPLYLPGTQSPQAGSTKTQVALLKSLGPVPAALGMPACSLSSSLRGTTSFQTSSLVCIVVSSTWILKLFISSLIAWLDHPSDFPFTSGYYPWDFMPQFPLLLTIGKPISQAQAGLSHSQKTHSESEFSIFWGCKR